LVLENSPHRLRFFQNRLSQHKLTVCRHAQAAINALQTIRFDIIFLDHDLEGGAADPSDENSGSEVARFIAEENIKAGCIILHTQNRIGRESMSTILMESEAIPYSKLKKIGLSAILEGCNKRNE
jgi:CheY-like chemotaxis protein